MPFQTSEDFITIPPLGVGEKKTVEAGPAACASTNFTS